MVLKAIWWDPILPHRLGAERHVNHNRYEQNWILNYPIEVHLEVFRLTTFTQQSFDTQNAQSQGDQTYEKYKTNATYWLL